MILVYFGPKNFPRVISLRLFPSSTWKHPTPALLEHPQRPHPAADVNATTDDALNTAAPRHAARSPRSSCTPPAVNRSCERVQPAAAECFSILYSSRQRSCVLCTAPAAHPPPPPRAAPALGVVALPFRGQSPQRQRPTTTTLQRCTKTARSGFGILDFGSSFLYSYIQYTTVCTTAAR